MRPRIALNLVRILLAAAIASAHTAADPSAAEDAMISRGNICWQVRYAEPDPFVPQVARDPGATFLAPPMGGSSPSQPHSYSENGSSGAST